MIDVPQFSNPNDEADWAEISCLFGKDPSISRSEIETALDNAEVDDPETTIENIWREIDWRHSVAPRIHPVAVAGMRLQRIKSWKISPSYTFMLLLTCQSLYRSAKTPEREWTRTAKLFEQLTTKALERYLGHAINIGAPRCEGVPKRFVDCLDYIGDVINEPRGRIRLFRQWAKDEGVDVIAWGPFDKRPSQVILLVQCAAGTDWRDKTTEISLDVWQEYIDFAVRPTRAFAFPCVCNVNSDWFYLSKQGGILLDRLRIGSFAIISSVLRRQLNDWSQRQLAHLGWT